jgi:hypothetical protein
MGHYFSYENDVVGFRPVINEGRDSVVVPSNIKNHKVPNCIRVRKKPPDFIKILKIISLHQPVPSFNAALGIGVALYEILQGLPRNNSHREAPNPFKLL